MTSYRTKFESVLNIEWYNGQTVWSVPERYASLHYRLIGWKLGITPSPLFSSMYYYALRPDVRRAGIDPLRHYMGFGWREGYDPHPLFDTGFYLEQSPELGDLDPLSHYLSTGWREGLKVTRLFDPAWYLEKYPDIAISGQEPLSHYLVKGRSEGRSPTRDGREILFDLPLKKHMLTLKSLPLFQGKKKRLSPPVIQPEPLSVRAINSDVVTGNNLEVFNALRNNARRKEGVRAPGIAELVRIKGPSPADAIASVPIGDQIEHDIEAAKIAAFGITPDFVAVQSKNLGSPILNKYNSMRHDATARFTFKPMLASSKHDGPLISVVMPVFRTPIVYLERAILSVLCQTYSNWQLVIVDDYSNSEALSALLAYYSAIDSRIKCVALSTNGGISHATNVGLEVLDGSYMALLDHDDMLTIDALHTVANAISENDSLDLIYSDECKIDGNNIADTIFTKPDWSPSLLFNCMYIGHLCVYRKELVKSVGGFNSRYDLSQDYDLALRISERSPNVHHINKVLYGWRMIAGSAACGGKPEARESNIAALQAAIDRRGLAGTAVALSTANRVKRSFPADAGRVSIVIPSDNLQHINDSLSSIALNSTYQNLEIVIVTNSELAKNIDCNHTNLRIILNLYDKEYNFSAKCNSGVQASTGDFIIFFNDDVRVISNDWVECLLEYLTIPSVGVVGPKLLYENGTIQHAGMVTGVRRLVGTAFHSFPASTTAHFNFAQSVREVSVICGACLGIRKEVFLDIGGFDSLNAPIAHSDVDLCFRVREAGYSCLYTPHAQLTHIGHLSIGKQNKKEFKKDKSDIYLMKRWPSYCKYDPFFPSTMRDILYIDSPQRFQYLPAGRDSAPKGRDVLIFSHDLSQSGAPKVVLDITKALVERGDFVVVISPTDGPMRDQLQRAGADIIVDELALQSNDNVADLGKNFDLVIANTAVCWPAVLQFSSFTTVAWYLHETALIEQLAREAGNFRLALEQAQIVLTGSRISTSHLRKVGYKGNVTEVPYGVEAVPTCSIQVDALRRIDIAVLATMEPRKGQDLVLRGYKQLATEIRSSCRLSFVGRAINPAYLNSLRVMAGGDDDIMFEGELSYAEYYNRLQHSDIIVCASRDDTLPLVSLNALSAGKIVVCSRTTGTSDYIEDGISGFVLKENTPEAICSTLTHIVASRSAMQDIGANAKRLFEREFKTSDFQVRFTRAIDRGSDIKL